MLNPLTPYGWRNVENMVNLYYGLPRVVDKWNSKGGQNEIRYKMSGLPFIKDIMVYEDSMKRINDYMENRGLSWEDVKYPALLAGAGTGGRLISDVASVARLYR